MIKKHALFFLLVVLAATGPLEAAENTTPAQDLRKPALPALEKEVKAQKLFFTSYDELGWVRQGPRKGHWNLLSQQLYYALTNWLIPYAGVDVWNRLGTRDNILTGGAYFKFPDKSYLRAETGWGADISYVYRWQATLEYERPLFKNLSGSFTGRYLNYPVNDVWIQSPGFRYYFKDHYAGVFYNVSETKDRGPAHWATVRGHFALHPRFALEAGTAIGERLYDIQELRASEQFGYILFTRGEFKVCKNLSAQAGFAYSQEKPSFIKKDVSFGITLKF